MISAILTNPYWLLSIGLVLIIIDVTIFGWSTIILTLLGVSFAIVGALILIGGPFFLTLTGLFISLSICAVACGLVFYFFFKNRQQHTQKEANHGYVGMTFRTEQSISANQAVTLRFNELNWQAFSDVDIPAGTLVEVVNVSMGELKIKPVE